MTQLVEKHPEYVGKRQINDLDQNLEGEKAILIRNGSGLGAEITSRGKSPYRAGCIKTVQRENKRQAAMAGLMTDSRPSPREEHCGDSVWILVGSAQAGQPTDQLW